MLLSPQGWRHAVSFVAKEHVSRIHRAMGRYGILTGGLLLLTLLLFLISLASGPADVSLFAAFKSLLSAPADVRQRDMLAAILLEIRLPRTVLAFMVGLTLGLVGAALQGLLRNPLAEPGVIGVSGCAALGAVIAFYTGLSDSFALALPLCGVIGALLAVIILYMLVGRDGSLLSLILAGIALNSLAAALTALALNLAPNPYAVFEIVFWLMGSLADRSFEHVWLALPLMLVGWVLVLSCGRGLDALTLGEDVAASLGIGVTQLRARLVVGSALAVGAAVSVSGVIGFIGLVVPHLIRPLVGARPQVLLPMSALGGAALTLAADIVVRRLATASELKLGVVTALIGAPFFLYLVVRSRRQWQ